LNFVRKKVYFLRGYLGGGGSYTKRYKKKNIKINDKFVGLITKVFLLNKNIVSQSLSLKRQKLTFVVKIEKVSST